MRMHGWGACGYEYALCVIARMASICMGNASGRICMLWNMPSHLACVVCVCVCRIKVYESMQTLWCILGMIKFVSWHNTGFCLCILFAYSAARKYSGLLSCIKQTNVTCTCTQYASGAFFGVIHRENKCICFIVCYFACIKKAISWTTLTKHVHMYILILGYAVSV